MPNFRHVRANAQCSNPSTDIDDFDCTIDLYIYEESIKERLNRKNMLLRGCKLKNTDWVIGLAVYVGEDTAIMMNGSKPFTKISNIESKVNYIILIVLVC